MTDYLNFIRPRRKNDKYFFLLSTVLCLMTLGFGWSGYISNQEALQIEAISEGMRQKVLSARVKPSRADVELHRKWENLQNEQIYPWAKVFGAAERMTDPDIELLEFRPNRNEKTVTFKGEGRTAESVVRLLEHLQEDAVFSKVYLLHTAKVEHGRLITRQFEIRAALLTE